MNTRKLVDKYLVAHTGKLWNWWGPRKLARLAAETSPGRFLCAHCRVDFPKSQVQVDHIEAIGPQPPAQTWDTYLDRKFVPITKLQILCLSCHKVKTRSDVKKMRGKKEC